MYIRSVEIDNVRSIEHFEMTFPEGKEAGWHVLIGENGAGKSTVARAIALGMVGSEEIPALRLNWADWLRKETKGATIEIVTKSPWPNPEGILGQVGIRDYSDRTNKISINYNNDGSNGPLLAYSTKLYYNGKAPDFFSAAYGPFRRFSGGNTEWDGIYKTYKRASAHLSIFNEDVALSDSLDFIRNLYIKGLDKSDRNSVDLNWNILENIKLFINKSELLPFGFKIESVNSETILIKNINAVIIPITQLSDGFRSVLSLVLDLLKQLLTWFRPYAIFEHLEEDDLAVIYLPGVVLIDEVDSHLHPTWQTQIGQWFTRHFPNFQFIVTTHSPLICRAAEKGSIWRLAAPASDQPSGEVTGLDRDRLIYGNVLDAYGTEVFGVGNERSDSSNQKLQKLAHLSQLNAYGKLSEEGKKEMNELRKILITDDTTEF